MDKWSGYRENERFIYKKVAWDTLAEGEEIGNIVDGSIELSAFTDLKASGTFTFYGGVVPNPNELVRIYYVFDDEEGEKVSTVLGTFFVDYSDVDYEYHEYENDDFEIVGELVPSGTVNLSSVLSVMLNIGPGYPYTIKKGTRYLDVAKELAERLNLRVLVTDDNEKQCTKDYVFEANDTWRNVINGALDRISYSALLVDKYGNVVMTPYEKIKNRAVAYTFNDGEESIFEPVISENNDWQTAGNVVHIYYESDEESIWAEAKNISGSRMSISERNGIEREVDNESDDSVIEFSTDNHVEELIERAVSRLKSSSNEVEHITFAHAFVDITPNDKVKLVYDGKEWIGTVQSMEISLSPQARTVTKIRRFKINDIVIESRGGRLEDDLL